MRPADPPFSGGGFYLLGTRGRRRPSGSVQRLCRNHAETEAKAKWQQAEESRKRCLHARVPPRLPVLRGPLQERNRSNHNGARYAAAPIAAPDRAPPPLFSNARIQAGRRKPRDPNCQSLLRDEPPRLVPLEQPPNRTFAARQN